jgi:ABC-type transport system involved in Fe-S cluster assembly fused permease/ATPase subunit
VTKAFDKVHSFSHDFHVNKKTGEVLIAMRSCEQINILLEIMIFQIISGILDLIVVDPFKTNLKVGRPVYVSACILGRFSQ